MQLLMKTVNVECFFLFTFGTGKDENLITNVTEFVDSKVFSGGGGGGDSGAGSSSSAQPQTPIEALSISVENCIKVVGKCYVDLLLFVPRSIKHALNPTKH